MKIIAIWGRIWWSAVTGRAYGAIFLCFHEFYSIFQDEYVPEPISDVFPQPMAYEPRPVAPRAVAAPVPRVSSSISASKPPLKLVKDPPATPAPSKAKKLSGPSTPVAKGLKSSAPPSKVPVPSTPGPKVPYPLYLFDIYKF